MTTIHFCSRLETHCCAFVQFQRDFLLGGTPCSSPIRHLGLSEVQLCSQRHQEVQTKDDLILFFSGNHPESAPYH